LKQNLRIVEAQNIFMLLHHQIFCKTNGKGHEIRSVDDCKNKIKILAAQKNVKYLHNFSKVN